MIKTAISVADIRVKEDGARRSVSSIYLYPGPSSDARAISLLKSEGLLALRNAGGLCTARFDADILTAGMDYASLRAGRRFLLGGAEIEISGVGKRCFENCPLHIGGERCPLQKSCAFARVTAPGRVCAGDAIKPL